MVKLKIRKNDRVMVMVGKDRGRVGKVKTVFPKKLRAIVEGVNIVKKHQKAGPTGASGGIIEKEAPIHISNLKLICPKCTDPVRVGYRILEDGSKVRICKKCGEAILAEEK